MVHYRKATIADKDELLDLINYVFSFDHQPHDFRARDPKRYGGDYPFWEEHYVAEEEGKLLATLSVVKRDWHGFSCGHVGQVCVHPYHRGRGFMKHLMNMANQDMEQEGFLFAELNGLRQRYEYFGYTQGGVRYRCTVTSTNLRHQPVVIDPTLSLIPTENAAFTIQKQGAMAGMISPYQISLSDESDLKAVLQLYFDATGKDSYDCLVSPYHQQRLETLTSFCEAISLEQSMQYLVFRFRELVTTCLQQRTDLRDGAVTLVPPNEPAFTVTVKGGVLSVEDALPPKQPDSLLALQSKLLSLTPHCLLPDDLATTNWVPLVL